MIPILNLPERNNLSISEPVPAVRLKEVSSRPISVPNHQLDFLVKITLLGVAVKPASETILIPVVSYSSLLNPEL